MSGVLPDGGEGAEDAEDVDWADGARSGDILQVTVTRLQWVLAWTISHYQARALSSHNNIRSKMSPIKNYNDVASQYSLLYIIEVDFY